MYVQIKIGKAFVAVVDKTKSKVTLVQTKICFFKRSKPSTYGYGMKEN